MTPREKNQVEKLRAARELIAKGWTQGAAARDASGKIVPFNSGAACRFCAVGALRRVTDDAPDYFDCIAPLEKDLGWDSVVWFNDRHTHDEVLKLFDDTIARLEGR